MAELNLQTQESTIIGGGVVIPKPKDQEGIGCSISDWNYLKNEIKTISFDFNYFQSIGFCIVGAGLSFGGNVYYKDNSESNDWLLCGAMIILGAISIRFGFDKHKTENKKPKNALKFMEKIEEPYTKEQNKTMTISN